ncbi:MAG: 33 kDa chaperonin [Candidatus Tectimicrobiota bacterium]|nr:MAG: 33 kDa chaperonin [Candidatus Tectomicrobia bacterium]
MDCLVSVVVPGEQVYGVAAVTTELVEQARALHGASPTAAAALGRLLTGGVLLSTQLKDPSHRLLLQVSGRGPVRKVVAEADGAGRVRGYLGQPVVQVPSRNGKLDVAAAVGKGILHVIKDVGLPQPASGTVPLVSGEIAEDLAAYLLQSEQIPSAVALGVFVSPDYTVTAAGGFLVQTLASVPESLLEHLERTLAAVPPVTAMVREGNTPYEMLQQALAGLPLQVVRQATPQWHCRCSRERVVAALVALGARELRQLIAEEEVTHVRCEFCTTAYTFTREELEALLREALT